VDHGKTTLVDAMFRFAGTLRHNQVLQDCALDSSPQERERGITILAKNTAVTWNGTRINIVDTPGHADFGGQVERTLAMADAVLLLVDAFEGPMPQTRFVLRKAFERDLRALVMVNKLDRPNARPHAVLTEVFDLFVDLGAHDEQLDFPVVYGSGREGYAMVEPEDERLDLTPLFDLILSEVPAPSIDSEGHVRFQAATLEHNDHLGRIAIGRVSRGTLRVGDRLRPCHPGRDPGAPLTIRSLMRQEGLERVAVSEIGCGDIAVVAGVDGVSIGDTLCPLDHLDPLPAITLDEPTLSMEFRVNTSPFAGQVGKHVTSRRILDRLKKATIRDVALRVGSGETSDAFRVDGRGVMHLSVLVENMRREGYEFAVGKPHVILKEVDGVICEPWERATVEVPADNAGRIIDYLGRRRGEMVHMDTLGSLALIEFLIPARGLIGARTALLTLSQGEATLSHVFETYRPDGGPIPRRTNGVLIADRDGNSVAYSLDGLTERGRFFIGPGVPVYEGMIVGEYNRSEDLDVNVCRPKKLTNMRAAGRDDNVKLPPPITMSLEELLEYIEDSELLEVTPTDLRLRKRVLTEVARRKEARRLKV
jgi:GTP-binding protein